MDKFSCLVCHSRRTAYGLLRSLSPYTSHLYCADYSYTPLQYSRHCKRFFCHESLYTADAALLVELFKSISVQILEDSGSIPFLFTGSDDYLHFFADNSNELSSYFHYSFLDDPVMLNSVLSKKELAHRALEFNIPIPRTFDDDCDITEIYDHLSFPLILKPAVKATSTINLVDSCFRLKRCETSRDLASGIELLNQHNSEYVVQEYIQGSDTDLFTLGLSVFRGKILGWSTSQKIRQFPSSAGECSLGTLVYLPELVELVSPMFKRLELSGIYQVEFKFCKGAYYLIEINPRIWSWFEIHNFAGVNLALLYIQAHSFAEDSDTAVVNPRSVNGVLWGFALIDLLHNCLLERNISLLQWLKDVLALNREAFFSLDDPLPFLSHLSHTVPYIFKKLRSKVNSSH